MNPEVLVTRNPRQPVDPRLLAGLRILYASSPRDVVEGGGDGGGGGGGDGGGGGGGGGGGLAGGGGGGKGEAGGGDDDGAAAADEGGGAADVMLAAPLTLGSLWESPLDRVREAYALRTCQAALALALGNFPTTLKEDEGILAKLEAEAAAAGGGGGSDGGAAAARQDLAAAVRFRMGKKSIISGAMKFVDERLRAVLSSDA